MEEPELRIGGWVQEKKRGKIRRIFSFLLIFIVSFLAAGPALVGHTELSIGSGSLYLNAGVWNGPFDENYATEFNGHLKISQESYESLDGDSGKLIILSLNSLLNLNYLNLQDITVSKVKQYIESEGLELQANGNILSETNSNLPPDTAIYQWNAKTTEESKFFSPDYDGNIFVKVFSWSYCYGLLNEFYCTAVISIAISVDQKHIEQATDLIENIDTNAMDVK